MPALFFASLFALVASANAPGTASPTLTDRYIALAIQGDLRQAHGILEGPEQDRAADFLDLKGRFRERFVDRTEPLSPGTGIGLLDEVVAAYRDYWAGSLLGDQSQALQDSALERALRDVLQARNPEAQEPGVYSQVEQSLQRLGVGVLAVSAPPLQDLFVWKRQRDQDFRVELSDGTRRVRVAFMSDFVSLGWKDYAALGLATTTGWVEDGVLYCVEKSYLTDTERFEVSFLKHEARHLADLERFPGLRSVDLEYRAKLTELAFASQTLLSVLEDFTAKSAPGSGSPHGEANYRVIQDLHTELFGWPPPDARYAWSTVATGRVNAAARRLLQRDTQARETLSDQVTP